jgi:hypothetical protein
VYARNLVKMTQKKDASNSHPRKEYTIAIRQVNIIALIFIIPIALLYALPFYILWQINIFRSIKYITLTIFLLSLPIGIVLHEGLHGLTWAFFTKNGLRSIKYGIKWEYLTPYCHCEEPLKVWQYIVGGLMPLFILGIVPGIWALINGNALLMFFGMFFTWTAGGDIQSVWMLRKFKKNQLIKDHPEEIGFIVVEK